MTMDKNCRKEMVFWFEFASTEFYIFLNPSSAKKYFTQCYKKMQSVENDKQSKILDLHCHINSLHTFFVV